MPLLKKATINTFSKTDQSARRSVGNSGRAHIMGREEGRKERVKVMQKEE